MVYLLLISLATHLAQATNAFLINDNAQEIPRAYHGHWFSYENGVGSSALVYEHTFGNLELVDKFTHKNDYNYNGFFDGVNSTMLMKVREGQHTCFYCVDVLMRTDNILQYRKSDCFTNNGGINMCPGKDQVPAVDQLATLFRLTVTTVNCMSTFDGVYQFAFEQEMGAGGICNNPDSTIEACKNPGSPYVDNEVFLMKYAKCSNVSTSTNHTVRYQCMGTWSAMVGPVSYTFAAVADTVERETRKRFKCLMTVKNQKSPDNSIRWVMSEFADCSKLKSLDNGPVRLTLQPKIQHCNSIPPGIDALVG
ncbi:hypothetical protein SNE40_004570 [Patella caerulea]|uniref:Uncharacterized protein n=1 Tax=Patella caerulea TaxID=87958 RepID=A0AAN8K5V8_PATCE